MIEAILSFKKNLFEEFFCDVFLGLIRC